MRNGIPELVRGRLDMWKVLEYGYWSYKERLENLFFDGQPLSEIQVIITPPLELNPFPERDQRDKYKPRTHSERQFTGRADIVVIYPKSGSHYLARIKTNKDWAIIEPVKENRAFWLVERKYLTGGVLDLNDVPYIRQYHNKEGRDLLSDFR